MKRNSGPWGKCASAVESGSISAFAQPDGHLGRVTIPPYAVGNGLERHAVHGRVTEAVKLLFPLAFGDMGGLAANRRRAAEHLFFVNRQELLIARQDERGDGHADIDALHAVDDRATLESD